MFGESYPGLFVLGEAHFTKTSRQEKQKQKKAKAQLTSSEGVVLVGGRWLLFTSLNNGTISKNHFRYSNNMKRSKYLITPFKEAAFVGSLLSAQSKIHRVELTQ